MIHTKIERHIGILQLSRPWVHNALNRQMMTDMAKCLKEWRDDPQVKVVLVTGEGDSFCSGGDLEEFQHLSKDETVRMLHQMKETLYELQTFPKPTIAALNGVAVGGGCEMATACDFRLAHAEVKLGFTQIHLGISTGWGGGTRLMHILPRSKALELLCTGELLDSNTAYQWGLVDHILPKDLFTEQALLWCAKLTNHSLPPLMTYKALALQMDENPAEMKENIDQEVEKGAQLWGTPEHRTAVDRFLKRDDKKKRT